MLSGDVSFKNAPNLASGGKFGESKASNDLLFTLTARLARSNLSLKHRHTSGISLLEANIIDTIRLRLASF